MASQAVELILCRNLLSAVELAAFIIDPDGTVVFFNDSAGQLIGRRFEEVGPLDQAQWSSQYGPFDEFGQLMPTDSLPLSVALREGLPANGRYHVRLEGGDLVRVEVSALPLVTAHGFQGAIVVFWRAEE